MMTAPTGHGSHRRHRLFALLLFAWLNLLIQPCLADLPATPIGMEQCDHGGSPDHPAPCPAMQAVHCETAADLNVDGPRADGASRERHLLALLPPAAANRIDAFTAACGDPGVAAGPSLNIRFCNLRN